MTVKPLGRPDATSKVEKFARYAKGGGVPRGSVGAARIARNEAGTPGSVEGWGWVAKCVEITRHESMPPAEDICEERLHHVRWGVPNGGIEG